MQAEQKKQIHKAFINHFGEFLDDIIMIFPENADIRTAKNTFNFIIKSNPRLMLIAWYNYVSLKYSKEIDTGDIDFFATKDYSSDMNDVDTPEDVLRAIDNIRKPFIGMTPENKDKTMKYLQNLKKLCGMYMEG